MIDPVAGSLPAAERIAALDILRGFALRGILIMNMPGFNSSFFAQADGSQSLWWLRTHDRGPMETLWARMTHGGGRASSAVEAAPR